LVVDPSIHPKESAAAIILTRFLAYCWQIPNTTRSRSSRFACYAAVTGHRDRVAAVPQ